MSGAIRVYLPLRIDQLHVLSTNRELLSAELRGFAVTPGLLAALPSPEDEEGGEYAALQDAAFQAAVQGVRIVVAADLDPDHVDEQFPRTPGSSAAQVTVRGGLTLPRVVSLQVLDPDDQRDPGAELELSWYDVTELAQLLAQLG